MLRNREQTSRRQKSENRSAVVYDDDTATYTDCISADDLMAVVTAATATAAADAETSHSQPMSGRY